MPATNRFVVRSRARALRAIPLGVLPAVAAACCFGLVASLVEAVEPPKVKRVGDGDGPAEKLVVGEVEYIAIPTFGGVFRARIDTGASSTSIYATDIEDFERDGNPWVRFVIRNPDGNKEYPLEMAVSSIAVVKKRREIGEMRRPAVMLDLTLGEATRQVEVNLADRTGFEYPLLIGRDFLRGLATVDVSKQFTQRTPGAPRRRGSRN